MNLRSYLHLLHPVRAVFWLILFTAVMTAGFKLFFGCDQPTAQFLSFAFAVPFLTGQCVANAAHAAMHRPFFLLLPAGRRHLRRFTLGALALAISLLAAGLAYDQRMPLATALGLTLALVPLPLTNPRRWIGRRGRAWLLGVAGGFLLLRLVGAARLVSALQELSWVILAGGAAAAVWSLRRGFDPGEMRARAHTPYNSVSGGLLFSLNHSAHRRFAQEADQYHARLVPDRTPAGQDWSVRQVGADLGSWVRVLRHATFGHHPGSRLRGQFLLAAMFAFYAMGLPFLTRVIIRGGQDFSSAMASYWNTLANLGSADFVTGGSSAVGFGPFLQMALGAALCLSLIRPQLAYPISRERLALVVFRQSLTQLALALVLPALVIFLVNLTGQVMSGHFRPALGLPPIMARDLGMLPLLPLLVCAATARRSAARVLLGLVVIIGLIVSSATLTLWAERCLTPAGLALGVMLSGLALLLLRWRLVRHYLACDLLAEPAPAR